MRVLFVLLCACSSSSSTPTADAPHGGGDAPPPSAGFRIHLGTDYMSSGQVTLRPARSSGGVYQGYFEAQSDLASVPNIDVHLHAPDAHLAQGMQLPCARSGTSDPSDETSLLLHWLDGDTYYTNVMSAPSCTITLTAVSQTSATAELSGTIYDEMDPNLSPQSFTASFVATVAN